MEMAQLPLRPQSLRVFDQVDTVDTVDTQKGWRPISMKIYLWFTYFQGGKKLEKMPWIIFE